MIKSKALNLLGMLALFMHLGLVACSTTSDQQQAEMGQEEVVYVDEEGNTVDVSTVNLEEYDVVDADNVVTDTELYAPAATETAETEAIEMDTATANELQDVLSGMNDTNTANVDMGTTDEIATVTDDSSTYESVATTTTYNNETNESYTNLGSQNDAAPSFDTSNLEAYVIQPGDTLSHIADRLYGSAGLWKQLAQVNQMSNPHLIYPGDKVFYDPSRSVAAFSNGDTRATQTVVVQAGETLSSISQRLFGSSDYWKYLATFNEGSLGNPDRITAGTTLKYRTPDNLAAAQYINPNAVSTVQDSTTTVIETNYQPTMIQDTTADSKESAH